MNTIADRHKRVWEVPQMRSSQETGTMPPFTREKTVSIRCASRETLVLERKEAAQSVAEHIYNIVVEYSTFGPYNSYRYQITHPKYYTDGAFVTQVVDMLKKAFPDFEVTPEAVENFRKEVIMHSIVVTW